MIDWDLEHSTQITRSFPMFTGLYRRGPAADSLRNAALFVGDWILVLGQFFSRLLVVAVVLSTGLGGGLSPGGSLALWLGLELLAFNLVRYAEGSWHLCGRGVDTVPVGLLMNGCFWLYCTALPMVYGRAPTIVCPHIYTGSVLVTVIANVGVLSLALASDPTGPGSVGAAAGFTHADARAALVAGHAVSTVGFLMIMWSVPPEKRQTFFIRRRLREHMEITLWETTQGSGVYGNTLTDARAELLASWAQRYWPRESTVRAWLWEHWPTWQHKQPEWFARQDFAEHFHTLELRVGHRPSAPLIRSQRLCS